MKAVIFVRHAEAVSKDLPLPDRDRPLSEDGRRELALMGPVLAQQAIKPEYIFSSSANRAAQTATIYASFYGLCASISFHDELYRASPRSLVDFIRRRDDAWRSIAIVGHNPELEQAAQSLWGGRFDGTVPTSACICLSFDVERWKEILENKGKLEYYEYPGKHRQGD